MYNTLRLKRSRYWNLRLQEGSILVTSALTLGKIYQISLNDLALALAIPDDEYTTVELTDQQTCDQYGALAQAGIILIDVLQQPYTTLRERDHALQENLWPPEAAVWSTSAETFHMTEAATHQDYDSIKTASPAFFRHLRDQQQPPPTFPVFSQDRPGTSLPAPQPPADSFYRTLLARRSIRYFNKTEPVTLEALSTLIYYTYATHRIRSTTKEPIKLIRQPTGELKMVDDGTCVQLTSYASAGARNPIVVRLLILRVTGLTPGVYLYHPLQHRLQQEKSLDKDTARTYARAIANGQTYAQDAAALILLTVRPKRHWAKYSRIKMAFDVMCIELGNSIGNAYLTATKEGLAATFTGAVDCSFALQHLEIDGIQERLLGLLAIGIPDTEKTQEMLHEDLAVVSINQPETDLNPLD